VSKRLWPAAIVLLSFSTHLAAQEILAPKPQVLNLRFENAAHLLAAQKAKLVEDMRGFETRSSGAQGLATAIEQAVQAAYADKGYWHAKVKAEVTPASNTPGSEVSATLRVIDEGRSFRLRHFTWSGISAFTEADLTDLIPLGPGKILERSKIAAGMNAIRSLYLAGGYLSFVAVPEVEVNDHDGTADLRIHVNEGGVFTVQGFDIIGLNRELRTRLMQAWPFKAGDVYRGENVENFLYSNAALLPTVSPNDVVCRTVDLSNHTIDFVLDFRPQPLACNEQGEAQFTRQSLNRVDSNR
jgi:outer membrane protein assembly factor BamA